MNQTCIILKQISGQDGVKSMNEKNCPLCGHAFEEGRTLFSADLDTGILVVKNVPAYICTACGNKFFSNEVMQRLEQLAQGVRSRSALVEVIVYDAA